MKSFSKICAFVASAPPLICPLLMMDALAYRAVCGTGCLRESLQVLSSVPSTPSWDQPCRPHLHTFPLTLRATLEAGEKGKQAGGGLPGSLLRFCGMAASPLQQDTVNTEGAWSRNKSQVRA